jgi:hypothetical protein
MTILIASEGPTAMLRHVFAENQETNKVQRLATG